MPYLLDHVNGDIRFENVSFHYEDHNEKVLSNVNLEVKPGDYVALVGTSGAGKTTLCSLIPRFYDVSSGAIYLDGKDIRKIKLKDLRNQIGIVQQDVYLFAGNIMENIRYGRPDATDEEVIRAAKLANAHDFIMEMPDNYGTDIGQRGVKLSGGQKQRLSIARAFLKNPPILIFDEATSALDNESEKVVQQSLERLAKDRTTFVIAHQSFHDPQCQKDPGADRRWNCRRRYTSGADGEGRRICETLQSRIVIVNSNYMRKDELQNERNKNRRRSRPDPLP